MNFVCLEEAYKPLIYSIFDNFKEASENDRVDFIFGRLDERLLRCESTEFVRYDTIHRIKELQKTNGVYCTILEIPNNFFHITSPANFEEICSIFDKTMYNIEIRMFFLEEAGRVKKYSKGFLVAHKKKKFIFNTTKWLKPSKTSTVKLDDTDFQNEIISYVFNLINKKLLL